MFFEIQAENIALKELHDKIDEIKFKFDQLHSELEVSRQANKILSDKIKDLEKRCGKSKQYSRRECLEIAGIPKSVDHKDLEKQVLDIFGSIDVNVKSNDVEACHRIGDKGRTIIKLSKRRNVQSIFANKKKLLDYWNLLEYKSHSVWFTER